MLPKIADVISDLIAELIAAIVLVIVGWLLRHFLKRLWNTVIDWLARQWRYLVVVVLLILIEVALYLVYASWWIIAFSIAHLALAMLAILLLFAPKWPTIVLPGFLDAWTTGGLIQKIDFDYPPEESPIENGWKLAEGARPAFEHPVDGFFGKVIAIQEVARSERPYALDYNVEPDARRLGRIVEFVAKLEPGAAIYAHVVTVQSKARSTSTKGWIQFRIGTGQPKRVSSSEWLLYITPTRPEGDWQPCRIDLRNAVNQTFGNDGWSFEQLIKFRLRGNLALAYISVFESQKR